MQSEQAMRACGKAVPAGNRENIPGVYEADTDSISGVHFALGEYGKSVYEA